jgi:hypothetical protein
MVNINDRCISRDWQPWQITYRDHGILSFAKNIFAFTFYVTRRLNTHTHTHTHEVTKILRFMMFFQINCLRESSYTFNVIYFWTQKFISELDVLVVYLTVNWMYLWFIYQWIGRIGGLFISELDVLVVFYQWIGCIGGLFISKLDVLVVYLSVN